MLCFLLFRRASVLGIFECAESVGSVLVVSTRRTNARILISKGFLYERCFVHCHFENELGIIRNVSNIIKYVSQMSFGELIFDLETNTKKVIRNIERTERKL